MKYNFKRCKLLLLKKTIPNNLKFYTPHPRRRKNKVLFRTTKGKRICHLKKLERKDQIKPNIGRIKAIINFRLKNKGIKNRKRTEKIN